MHLLPAPFAVLANRAKYYALIEAELPWLRLTGDGISGRNIFGLVLTLLALMGPLLVTLLQRRAT